MNAKEIVAKLDQLKLGLDNEMNVATAELDYWINLQSKYKLPEQFSDATIVFGRGSKDSLRITKSDTRLYRNVRNTHYSRLWAEIDRLIKSEIDEARSIIAALEDKFQSDVTEMLKNRG